jgi:uncharacterized protein with HEPN domain
MTRRDDTTRLRHMLDHAREAVDLARGGSRLSLDADRKLNLALVRLVEIVGEAAARVTPATQQRLADIPSKDLVGMRNRMIHGYDEVDFDILWDVVELHLPPLIDQLRVAIGGGA